MVDNEQRERAVERFVTLAGCQRETAESLVEAILEASQIQALDLIIGTGPIPSNMTANRADQLRHVCLSANRILGQREVEVLFRATAASARMTLTYMRATYEEALRGQFLDRMRSDVVITETGTVDEGLTWRLLFTETSTYELAWSEAQRLGLDRHGLTQSSPTRHMITVPRSIVREGAHVQTLSLLGLDTPEEETR